MEPPIANWSVLTLPSITVPASFKFCVTVDSYVGTKLDKILLAAVVRTSFVQYKSLLAIGIPSNAPKLSPFARRLSDASASAIALSGVSVIKAFKTRPFSISAK